MGEIIAVTGTDGGVGATTTAILLGGGTGERRRDVALVDATVSGTRLTDVLDADPEDRLAAVVRDELPLRDLKQEGPHGTAVYPGSPSVEWGSVTPEGVASLYDTLRDRHELTFVDCGAPGTPASSLWLAHADMLVIVTGAGDPVATTQLRSTADAFEVTVGGVVVNRADDPEAAIEGWQPETVLAVLPTDETVAESAAASQTPYRHDPDSPIADTGWRLAGRFAGDEGADASVVVPDGTYEPAPEDVRTQTPEDVRTQTPEDGRTQTPEDGRTQTPEDGRTQTPEDVRTQTPEDGRNQERVHAGATDPEATREVAGTPNRETKASHDSPAGDVDGDQPTPRDDGSAPSEHGTRNRDPPASRTPPGRRPSDSSEASPLRSEDPDRPDDPVTIPIEGSDDEEMEPAASDDRGGEPAASDDRGGEPAASDDRGGESVASDDRGGESVASDETASSATGANGGQIEPDERLPSGTAVNASTGRDRSPADRDEVDGSSRQGESRAPPSPAHGPEDAGESLPANQPEPTMDDQNRPSDDQTEDGQHRSHPEQGVESQDPTPDPTDDEPGSTANDREADRPGVEADDTDERRITIGRDPDDSEQPDDFGTDEETTTRQTTGTDEETTTRQTTGTDEETTTRQTTGTDETTDIRGDNGNDHGAPAPTENESPTTEISDSDDSPGKTDDTNDSEPVADGNERATGASLRERVEELAAETMESSLEDAEEGVDPDELDDLSEGELRELLVELGVPGEIPDYVTVSGDHLTSRGVPRAVDDREGDTDANATANDGRNTEGDDQQTDPRNLRSVVELIVEQTEAEYGSESEPTLQIPDDAIGEGGVPVDLDELSDDIEVDADELDDLDEW